VDQLFEAFPGRIYRPVVDEAVRILGIVGWGGSAPNINSCSLHFEVGRTRERIEISIAAHAPTRRWQADPLLHLLGAVASPGKSPRFPLLIERGKQRIRVDGRERVFTIYTAADAAVAMARFEKLQLSIECHRSRLATIALLPLEADALRQVRSNRPTPPG
jgi:hypothetical protein